MLRLTVTVAMSPSIAHAASDALFAAAARSAAVHG
jgi:hypothetical protein